MVPDRPGMHASGPQLLVVDDDRDTRELLSVYLKKQGFEVAAVPDGAAMDAWLDRHPAELVILDLMLPGEDGLSIARRLRAERRLPIIMISARGTDIDRIVGLEVGADDYLPKPFNPRELLARIRAVLRRNSMLGAETNQPEEEFLFGAFVFMPESRRLMRDSEEVELSKAEFDLLDVFVRHPNKVLSRDVIMDRLSGHDRDPFDRSIDVRVTRLRHKIENDPAHPNFIRTIWGVGYQFTPTGNLP